VRGGKGIGGGDEPIAYVLKTVGLWGKARGGGRGNRRTLIEGLEYFKNSIKGGETAKKRVLGDEKGRGVFVTASRKIHNKNT